MLTALINIKQSEKKPTLILFTMFFTIVFATITGSAMRDTIFLIQFNKKFLPIMYLFIAIAMTFLVTIYNKYSSEKDQLSLLILLGLLFSLTLLIFQFYLSTWTIPIFYIWIEIITIFSIMQFWLVAGEIFNPRQAKRIFPLIIAGGSIAAIFSGYCIGSFVKYFGSNNLLYLTICFLIGNALLGVFLNPFRSHEKKIQPKQEPELNFKNIKKESYLFSIGLAVAFSAIISRLIDYQFKIVAVSSYPNQDDLVNFFGSFYALTGLATLLMQITATGFILKRFGILIGLLILPISISFGSVGFLFSGTLFTVYLAKFSDQVFKFSINNSIKEVLWLPISSKKKSQSKPIIDGVVRSAAEGIAGILIFLLVAFKLMPESNIKFLSILVLIGIVFWIWNCFKMSDGYIKSIIGSIENRRLDLDDINFDVNDANTVSTIEDTLLCEDELKQLFAIDILWKLPLTPWKNTLEFLFTNGTLPVQRAILELAWNDDEIIPDNLVLTKIMAEDEVSPYALICYNDRGLDHSSIINYLTHENTILKIAYAITVLSNQKNHNQALKVLNEIHKSKIPNHKIQLLSFIKKFPKIFSDEYIIEYLSNNSSDIKNATLDFLISNPKNIFFEKIIFLLAKPETEKKAKQALLALNKSWTSEKLIKILSNPATETKYAKSILNIMHSFDDKRLIKIILGMIKSHHISIINKSSNCLIKISKLNNININELYEIEEYIKIIAKRAFQLHLFRSTILHDQNSALIIDHIDHDIEKISPILLKLGTLREPQIPIEKYIHFIETKDKQLLPLVLELIETTFSSHAKKFVLPLIDPDTKPDKIAIGIFKDKFLTKDEMLLFWINSSHLWKKTIALNYCIKNEKAKLLTQATWKTKKNIQTEYNLLNSQEIAYINRNFLNNEISIEENNKMYSILEKTLLLKTVNLFQKIPGNVLSKIAQIATEISLETDDVIFQEGEPGKSLFVIITGKVNILNDNQIIANLEKGNCIGEMSILDQAPRSADAIAAEESILLQIDQDGFFELMAGNPDIMKEIIKMLTKRLRKMNKKLTDSLK